MLILILLLGVLFGMTIALAHTDNSPAIVITPRIQPIQPYGDRQ